MRTPEFILRKCERLFPDYLRARMEGAAFFPCELPLGEVKAGQDFATLRAQADGWQRTGFRGEILWETRRFRRLDLGEQPVPRSVRFPDAESFETTLGRTGDVRRFLAAVEQTRVLCPELLPWIARSPLKVLDAGEAWPSLLKVCSWLRANPRPGIYPREVPVEVPTKFIEERATKAWLRELLPLVLAPEHVRESDDFHERFGFRKKEPLFQLRALSPGVLGPDWPTTERHLALPLSSIVALRPAASRVLIVENEMTFLSLPELPDTLALFGAGDASALLAHARWIGQKEAFYWGDIDAHGFHGLNVLRRAFPSLTAVLMDATIWGRWAQFRETAGEVSAESTECLHPDEKALHDLVRDAGQMLEQEKIPPAWAASELRARLGRPATPD